MKYATFNAAYPNVISDVSEHPEFFNAPRGFASREKLGYHFQIKDPVQRVYFGAKRKTNIVFNFAEALWYLSDNNRLDYIQYYNSRMHQYSMDGRILTGTAYGPKIFEYGNAKVNQWENVKRILKADPDSKRAFIQILDANELLVTDNLDVACTIGLQFFIRENALHMVAFMRANDAFRGMVSDVFSFTLIQETMARELGLSVGTFYHQVGTMHIYQPDDQWVADILAEPQPVDWQFPAMPTGNNWPAINRLMEFEEALRHDFWHPTVAEIAESGLPEYWRQVLTLFAIYQQLHFKRPVDTELFESLAPVYQTLMANKWPKSLPEPITTGGSTNA